MKICYYNGLKTENFPEKPEGDARILEINDGYTEITSKAEGWKLKLKGEVKAVDLTLAHLKGKYLTESSILAVSRETRNTYGNDVHGWSVYRDEWLIRFISDPEFTVKNDIVRSAPDIKSEDILPGYEVTGYSMEIKNPGHIEYPFYNIAIIRPVGEYVKFFLLVMKSKLNSNNEFSDTVKSFKEIPVEGKQISSVTSYNLKIPAIWSQETKAYFEKMSNQTEVDWGAFYAHNNPAYIDWLTGAEGWNHKPEIFMTYLHIAYYEHMCFLDKPYIEKYSGGNGFDGKPVLNLTYQFTTSNNSDLARTTPMFDILRGRYDEHFRRFARDLKEYRHPVIFRLNNEMNTDWTSYCGEVTLLDPDIFVLCWRRLYDIFMEEGVDNTIWVFNPQAITFPYCSWGDALTYMPGEDYVQMLGLTNYEQGNKETLKSFKELYEYSYNNGTSGYFLAYPWIIGEFGCGAGGQSDKKTAGWNSALQGKWVEGMADCFNRNREPGYEFCKNIKIAIWFSANDYASLDGKDYISNYFQLDKGTPEAIDALRKWFSEKK